MTVSKLSADVCKDKGQIRNVCSSLYDLNEITCANPKASCSLLSAEELTKEGLRITPKLLTEIISLTDMQILYMY